VPNQTCRGQRQKLSDCCAHVVRRLQLCVRRPRMSSCLHASKGSKTLKEQRDGLFRKRSICFPIVCQRAVRQKWPTSFCVCRLEASIHVLLSCVLKNGEASRLEACQASGRNIRKSVEAQVGFIVFGPSASTLQTTIIQNSKPLDIKLAFNGHTRESTWNAQVRLQNKTAPPRNSLCLKHTSLDDRGLTAPASGPGRSS
jgi:hypothetical protein